MSRNPVVWANAIAGVLSALVSVGVLNASQETVVNGWVQALVGAAGFLLPLIAGFLAQRRTTPWPVTPAAARRDPNLRA